MKQTIINYEISVSNLKMEIIKNNKQSSALIPEKFKICKFNLENFDNEPDLDAHEGDIGQSHQLHPTI